jgi:hypothetical protein
VTRNGALDCSRVGSEGVVSDLHLVFLAKQGSSSGGPLVGVMVSLIERGDSLLRRGCHGRMQCGHHTISASTGTENCNAAQGLMIQFHTVVRTENAPNAAPRDVTSGE